MHEGLREGEDGRVRCWWPGADPDYVRYHDEDWGTPMHGDQELFELLCLEGFQAGLSWITILRKRPAFRAAFDGFDPEVVAAYGDDDIARLMADAGIVRNRLKVDATITNARATVGLRDSGGLEDFIRRFAPEQQPAPEHTGQMVSTSPESVALSKALKKAGFAFVGPTTMYALMEATGLVNDHLVGCHRR